VAAQPQQEQQERPTQVPVVAAADIATNQTHLLQVVLVVQALLSCVTFSLRLQHPIFSVLMTQE
jgi:hypothetical protein